MKKTDYDAKLKRAEEHLLAKQYPKALAEFIGLYKSNKPLGEKLGFPDQIEKLQKLVKEQGFLSIRGLGVIILEALNKKNQFQEIYRLPISCEKDDDGNDTHPLRLPAILRTSFKKAVSEAWLEKEVNKFEKKEGKADLGLDQKIKELEEKVNDRDTVIKKFAVDYDLLKHENKDLQSQIAELKKPAEKGTEEKI